METLKDVLDKLDPWMVSRSSTQESDYEAASDVDLWKGWLLQKSGSETMVSERKEMTDQFTQMAIDSPLASQSLNSTIWAWRILGILEEESKGSIKGSCRTRGWINSTACRSPCFEYQGTVGNVEILVDFSLDSEEQIDQTLKRKPSQSQSTGKLLLTADLDKRMVKKLSDAEAVYTIKEDEEVHNFDSCGAKGSDSALVWISSLLWGTSNFDRVDNSDLTIDTHNWVSYSCDEGSGIGACAINSGIRSNHETPNAFDVASKGYGNKGAKPASDVAVPPHSPIQHESYTGGQRQVHLR